MILLLFHVLICHLFCCSCGGADKNGFKGAGGRPSSYNNNNNATTQPDHGYLRCCSSNLKKRKWIFPKANTSDVFVCRLAFMHRSAPLSFSCKCTFILLLRIYYVWAFRKTSTSLGDENSVQRGVHNLWQGQIGWLDTFLSLNNNWGSSTCCKDDPWLLCVDPLEPSGRIHDFLESIIIALLLKPNAEKI